MSFDRIVKIAAAVSVAGMIAFVSTQLGSRTVHADEQDSNKNLVAIGLRIAPTFLKTEGKDRDLVGLGSFIVNAQVDCNGCHGSDPANEYVPGHNPYLLAPNNRAPQFNQATYMNGGQNFRPAGPGVVIDVNSALYGGPGLGPNIIARNLTPDYTGNPEGGHDLNSFITIMRTGHDYDKLHLNCGGSVTDNCYSAPVNGALLQIMPWPKFQHMTDYQLTAIWTYLSTVPCNPHNDAQGDKFPWLKNVCP